jgi:hypothetical protein
MADTELNRSWSWQLLPFRPWEVISTTTDICYFQSRHMQTGSSRPELKSQLEFYRGEGKALKELERPNLAHGLIINIQYHRRI